jgi:hypothetical protein
MSSLRAVRYRKLALATKERADADLLIKLADESDRGILCRMAFSAAASLRYAERAERKKVPRCYPASLARTHAFRNLMKAV